MNTQDKFILMVDDDEEDRMLLKDAFDDLGYHEAIQFEENGENALDYIRESASAGNLPRLVILDLNMPKMNGPQTLKVLKSEPGLQHITVVIYSTSLNPVEKEECLKLGAHSYIVKPVSYSDSLRIADDFYQLSLGPKDRLKEKDEKIEH